MRGRLTRMLPRRVLAALPLLALVASCSADSKPDQPTQSATPSAAPVSIVGTWKADMSGMLGPDGAKAVRLGKPDATDAEVAAAMKLVSEQMRAAGGVPTQTFRPDGTGESSGVVIDHPITDQFRWELVEATPGRIVINTWTTGRADKERTPFVVESPDVLRYADGPLKGEKIVRVK